MSAVPRREYLARYFDSGLKLPKTLNKEKIEFKQVDRISRALSVVLVAGSTPRRLGADATNQELALDKKRARRMAAALAQSLKGWTMHKPVHDNEEQVRREGARILWDSWLIKHSSDVQDALRLAATWAILNDEERWGRSCVVKLENELNWTDYALRD
jgi:hypothetical protein